MFVKVMQPERTEKILAFIEDYIEKHNNSPSGRDIATGTGLPLTTVQRYLRYLRDNDLIDYDGTRSIVTKKQSQIKEASSLVPVLGNVSCGVPKFAEGNIEEYVRLPVSLFGRGDFFLLRANGDSMTEVGIDDGDLVLIRQSDTAEPGQIVVALMEEEATLKRYYPEPEYHRVRLHPENHEMTDIYVDDCIVQGIAVKVLKDLA